MELKHSFTVPVPLDRAWDVLLDVERVAPCMPGASLDSVDGNDITGRIKVRVGPISMTYTGKASFTERDREAGVVMLEASGKDTRGAGTASATVRSELTAAGAATEVTVVTNLSVTGKPAQFGRGVLNEVGGKLIGIFADNLAQMLADDGGGAAVAPEAAGDSSAPEPVKAAQTEAPAAAAVGGPDLDAPIEDLNLPVRAYNGLRRAGVATVGDLAAKTPQELLDIDNIGPASVEEIRQRLADRGLTLSEAPASANGASGPAPAVPASTAPASTAPASTAPASTAPASTAPASGVPADSAPSGTAPSSSASAGTAASEPGRAPLRTVSAAEPSDDDAIDLLSVAGLPVLKRAIPVAVGVLAVVGIALGLRRRGRHRR
jgi:carbon monoxide dehydrogenase subunit G